MRKGVGKPQGIQFIPPNCKRYAYRAKPALYTVYVPKISLSSFCAIRKREENTFVGAASNNFIGQLWRFIERFDADV